MKKRLKIFTGPHGGFILFASVVTIVFLLFLVFGSGNNLIHWTRAKREISRNRQQIEWYQEAIDDIDSRIESLTTDRDSIEKHAREHYHFAEPGDDVFLISE